MSDHPELARICAKRIDDGASMLQYATIKDLLTVRKTYLDQRADCG